MENVYEVYWVKLPTHINIYREGYVGITKNGVSTRINQHVRDAVSGHNSFVFQRAILKYGVENLDVMVVAKCTERVANAVEYHLRPLVNIGWNVAPGGGMENVSELTTKAWEDNPERRLEASKRTKEMWKNEEYRKMRAEASRTQWENEEYRAQMSEKLSVAWDAERRHFQSEKMQERWKDTDKKSKMYEARWGKEPSQEYLLNLSNNTKWQWENNPKYREVITKATTERWKDEEFRKYTLPKMSEAAKKRHARNPWWMHPKTNKDNVRNAGHYYDTWVSLGKCGYVKLEKCLGLNRAATLSNMVKKFSDGWNPYKDNKWVENYYEQRTTMD